MMNKNEAIEYFEKKRKRAHPCDIQYYDAAISALRRDETNEPLTVEQVKKLEGYPVLAHIFEKGFEDHWYIIQKVEEEKIYFEGACRLYAPISELGKTYNLYAYTTAQQTPNLTNGDKIRSMSDEELDMFFHEIKNRAGIIVLGKKPELLEELVDLEWIKQIAEED